MEQNSYYAIIPATVRYDKELPDGAKLLYGEITALCNQRGFCWARNQHFADLYGKSVSTIKRWISMLADKGYIIRNFRYKDGTKEIDERCISICDNPSQIWADVGSKIVPPPVQKRDGGGCKNEPVNIKDINNTDEYIPPIVPQDKKTKKKQEEVEPLPVPSEILPQWNAWVDMREEKKKSLTAYAHNLALGKLEKLAPNDFEKQRQILDNSTLSGWAGVFPLKEEQKKQSTGNPQSAASYDMSELERLVNYGDIL